MRILLLNPNTTAGITERLAAAAGKVLAPDTTLVPLTASRGVPYISTRAEAQIAGAIVLEMLAEYHDKVDAAVIAAFGDPGLTGARELFDFPIVGMGEAAMHTACMLGGRFAIVSFASALAPWYQESVDSLGLTSRCAGIRMLDGTFQSITDVQQEKEELLVQLALATVVETAADVIILGGAPLSGLAEKVRDRVPVPLVEQVQSAVMQAQLLVRLNVRKASVGTFKRPAAKPTKGLPEMLAARIEHRDRS